MLPIRFRHPGNYSMIKIINWVCEDNNFSIPTQARFKFSFLNSQLSTFFSKLSTLNSQLFSLNFHLQYVL